MGQHSASESEDGGAFSANSPLSSNEGDSIGGKSTGNGVILKKGPWTSAEDAVLMDYVRKNGEGNWNAVQKHTGLARCGKSCRLRWANHLRPNLKKGAFTLEEERVIIELHAKMGNKWARMAAHLPGRTDNEIKNYWNTRIKRRQRAGLPLYPPNLYLPEQSKSHQPLSSPSNCTEDFTSYDDILLPYNDHTKSDSMSGLFSNSHQNPEYGISPSLSIISPHSYTIAERQDEPVLHHVSSDASEPSLFVASRATSLEVNCLSQSFSMTFPGDHSHSRKAIGFCQDTQFVSGIIPSAPKHPIDAQKLELPSLQYQETSSGFWDPKSKASDTVTHCPVSGALSWNCPTSGGSGLLEDLIYGAKALSNSDSHSACWATPCNINLEDLPGNSASNGCSTGKANFDPFLTSDYLVELDSIGRVATTTMGSSLEDIIVHHFRPVTVDESWMLLDEMGNDHRCSDDSIAATLGDASKHHSSSSTSCLE